MNDPAFTNDERTLLSKVLRQACADLGAVDDKTRSRIANRILSMACDGERDFETLRSRAISGLARNL
jgi:hypothetical protein